VTENVRPNAQELESLVMGRAGWRHPDDYPERLFHYTSSTALLGILTSGELWFTDFRYLNDLSELKYGVDLFINELLVAYDRETDDQARRLVSAVRLHFSDALLQTDQFVFCMCAENNLLNQWRVYGKDTVPVSIELATRGFMFVDWEPHDFDLLPMVYDESLQKRIVKEAVAVGMSYAIRHRQWISSSKENFNSFIEMLATEFIAWCAIMKHPQFEVEKEWRLAVKWAAGPRFNMGQRYRSSPAGIVPYLAVRPTKGEEGTVNTGRLPIRSLTIGPCSYPELQQRTLQELLYQHVMADVEVTLSNLPIRV